MGLTTEAQYYNHGGIERNLAQPSIFSDNSSKNS
jgi:hypothetical protein